jgi:superfamily II DNA or RNA helicase
MANIAGTAHVVQTVPLQNSAGRVTLRPYQEEALRAIADGLARGVRRQLIVLPVASGKTILAARLPEIAGDGRMIYLAHRQELLTQTRSILRRERPDRACGMERADQRADLSTPNVVATVQSLAQPGRLERYTPELWPLMVTDEAHRSVARGYRTIFQHFRHLRGPASAERADGLLLGLTGTSHRTDKVGLGAVFQEIIYNRTLREMTEAGYLAPLRGWTQNTQLDLGDLRTHKTADGDRDYDLASLSRAVNTPERNAMVVEATRTFALSEGRPTLVFCVDIRHTESLTQLFTRAGVRAAALHSKMPDDARANILSDFRDGALQVLLNCEILLEGVDLPQVAAITMARPTQSSLLFTQAVGRGLRLSPETGKTDCLIIDLVDNAPHHARSLVTLPTLFGLPPQFRLAGERVDDAAARLDLAAQALESGLDDQALARVRSVADIPRLFREFDFWKITGIAPAEAELTPFLWQRLPGGVRILSVPKPKPIIDPEHFTLTQSDTPRSERIVIQPNALDHYEVRIVRGATEITKLTEVGSLQEAFAAANKHVSHAYPDRLGLLRRDQAWRAHPISQKQIEILRRFRIPHPETLTSGQASQLINYATLLRLNERQTHVPRADEPATPRMRRYLRWLGIMPEPGLTKREAGRLIRAGKAARLARKRARADKEPVA